jgi:general secretion pathway protein H
MSASDPEQLVWDTLNEAREQALTSHRPVWLQPGKDNKLLQWTDGVVSRSKALPAGCTLQLLQARTGNLVLIGGQAVETQEVAAVRFYPDGTCDSFRVQLRRDQAPTRILAVDPWTCAPIINPDKSPR